MEDDEYGERSEKYEQTVENVFVDQTIEGVGFQPSGDTCVSGRVVFHGPDSFDVVFVETWDVVDDDACKQYGGLDSDSRDRAQHLGAKRQADDNEPVERDQDGDPDRAELGGVDERVDELVEEGQEGITRVVVVDGERREDLGNPGRREEEVVHDGHHLEQVGGGTVAVAFDLCKTNKDYLIEYYVCVRTALVSSSQGVSDS